MTTIKDRNEFIVELIERVKNELLTECGKYPDTWDGVELRWRVRDAFAGVVFGGYTDKRDKRFKDYKNTCLIKNLI